MTEAQDKTSTPSKFDADLALLIGVIAIDVVFHFLERRKKTASLPDKDVLRLEVERVVSERLAEMSEDKNREKAPLHLNEHLKPFFQEIADSEGIPVEKVDAALVRSLAESAREKRLKDHREEFGETPLMSPEEFGRQSRAKLRAFLERRQVPAERQALDLTSSHVSERAKESLEKAHTYLGEWLSRRNLGK